MKKLNESFGVGDLQLVLEPKLHIDEFCSKIGKDADIIVISFLINDKTAAIDLVDFFEKGYDFILDADISASEIKPGSYLVFAELLRRHRVIDQLFKLIDDLSAASKLNRKDWKFRYINNEKYFQCTIEELKNHIPLTPKAYKEKFVLPIKEMQEHAGILIHSDYDSNDIDIQKIQHAAGIK